MSLPVRRALMVAAAALFLLAAASSALSLPAAEPQALLQKGKGFKGPSGVYRDRVTPHWFAGDTKFWYRNDLKDRTKEFVLVDAEKGTRTPAFDHAKLAAALAKAADTEVRADRLPFDEIEFSEDVTTVRFDAAGKRWKCDLATYTCTDVGPARKKNTKEPTVAKEAGIAPDAESPWIDDIREQPIAVQFQPKRDPDRARSPDGKWTAQIKEYNVVLRDADGKETPLTKDGKDGIAYSAAQLVARLEGAGRLPRRAGRTEGSPHPRVVAARRRPGGALIASVRPPRRQVRRLRTAALRRRRTRRKSPLRTARSASHGLRDAAPPLGEGRQHLHLPANRPRPPAVPPRRGRCHTGKSRNLIDEKTETFIWTAHTENIGTPARDVAGEDRRDHLRLREERLAAPLPDRRQDREGEERDHDRRVRRPRESTASTRRSGRSGSAPAARTRTRTRTSSTTTASTSTAPDLVALTEGNGTHTVAFSPDRKYLIDTYSRVDHAAGRRTAPRRRRQARVRSSKRPTSPS